jgi:uncharacterized membrane protein
VRAERLTTGVARRSTLPAIAVPAFLLLLAIAGLGVSSYLTYTHWANVTIACSGFESCETVNNSEYAEMAGIPVAFLGALFYLALIAAALAWLWLRPQGPAWPVMSFWGLALVGTLYSAYLTYLELFVIEAICIYCVASAAIVLGCFLISTAWNVRQSQDEET